MWSVMAGANRMRNGRSEPTINEAVVDVDPKACAKTALPVVIGARCRMSSLGLARNQRFAGKEGTVVGNSRLNSSVRVLFDGRKTPISLHRDYIEIV
jgi:hypothetical protein